MVTAGSIHTCAVMSAGTMRCWGNGQEGAVGLGNTLDLGDDGAPGSVPHILLGGLVTVDPPIDVTESLP